MNLEFKILIILLLAPTIAVKAWARERVLQAAAVFATLIFVAVTTCGAVPDRPRTAPDTWRVLLIFSEGKDLPGNVLLEQAIRGAFDKGASRRVEFYTEHLDASRFSDETHYRIFRDYLGAKYAGQDPDLLMIVMARDFHLAERLPTEVFRSVPTVFLTTGDLPIPSGLDRPGMMGLVGELDVNGTLALTKQLQPSLRRMVVVGGRNEADQRTIERIGSASLLMQGVTFEFWTNQTFSECLTNSRDLPSDTALLLSTIYEDADGQTIYMTHAARMLAPIADGPVYTFSPGAVASGAAGGRVVDVSAMGEKLAGMGLRMLRPGGKRAHGIERTTVSKVMVDWKALQQWKINPARLPADAVVLNRPRSLWEEHKWLISGVVAVIAAQALTIAGLIMQRLLRRRAEAEILRQRDELAHVTRVSTMGQLASSLAHEINQPLGAILRNTEAAELFLQRDNPDVQELKAILADIRKDDQRAGGVIDRMRSLLKRETLHHEPLNLQTLLQETASLTMPDAKARQIRLTVENAANLPPVRGDRIHLQQVFLNLILNAMDAVKARANGEQTVTLSATRGAENNLEIRVTDSGTGIAPEKLDHIFQPFFTTKSQGLGMGLAISKTIIEAHHGTIRAENNRTAGATFLILLPAESSSSL